MKKLFSILIFIALAMTIGTPSGLAAIGKVLRLDGEGDYVDLPNSNELHFKDSDFTAELWFKWNGDNGELYQVGGAWACREFRMFIEHNMFKITLLGTSGCIYDSYPIGDTLTTGIWYHFVVTRSGNDFKVYRNGQYLGIFASSSYALADSGLAPQIGKGDYYFDGFIDEVRIWNIARTQEEIQDAMNRTLTSDEINSGNVAGYWNFDDGTADDLSPNGNHGTLMGDARIGDISGDGTISAYDAALILQFVVGLIDTLPPPAKSPADGILRDYSVSIPELTTRPGNRIKVPVAINDATGLTAGGIILKYDCSVIRAVDALPTSMLSGAYWKANTQRAGEIRFAFAAVEPIKGAGNLLTVEFEPLNDTAGRESPIIFETVQFVQSQSIRTIDGKVTILPEKSMLLQNYPNPFNPETWIPYQLADDSPVTISIYNAKGELVRTLNLGYQSAGVYIAKSKAAYWNGKDALGERVANGVYFYRLQAGNFSAVRKLVVLK